MLMSGTSEGAAPPIPYSLDPIWSSPLCQAPPRILEKLNRNTAHHHYVTADAASMPDEPNNFFFMCQK